MRVPPARVRVLGGNPFHGSDALVFTEGDYPWNLSLGRHTGDGKFDGEAFLGRLWMLFLGGEGKGKRNSRSRTAICFRRTTRGSKQPFLCYILYNEQWRFRYNICRPSRSDPLQESYIVSRIH